MAGQDFLVLLLSFSFLVLSRLTHNNSYGWARISKKRIKRMKRRKSWAAGYLFPRLDSYNKYLNLIFYKSMSPNVLGNSLRYAQRFTFLGFQTNLRLPQSGAFHAVWIRPRKGKSVAFFFLFYLCTFLDQDELSFIFYCLVHKNDKD